MPTELLLIGISFVLENCKFLIGVKIDGLRLVTPVTKFLQIEGVGMASVQLCESGTRNENKGP